MFICKVGRYNVNRERFDSKRYKIISYIIIFNIYFKLQSSLTEVNKTGTAITVSWTTNSTDADGYVVNATSDTDTVTQQVKGCNQSTTTLKGLGVGTTHSIIVRAYQDILGPVSNTLSVQTYPRINNDIVVLPRLRVGKIRHFGCHCLAAPSRGQD